MKRLFIKAIRILCILALVPASAWLLREYSVNYARAEISRSYAPVSVVPELAGLALNYQHHDYQRIVINGQSLRYRRAHWAGSPESLLARLEKQINTRETTSSRYRFKHAGAGWFFIGRLPDPEQAQSRGFMLKATRQTSGTQLWIWEFKQSSIATDHTDINVSLPQGLSPLPGSMQLFSSQETSPDRLHTLSGYSAAGSVTAHALYYHTMLEQAGYAPSHPLLETSQGGRLLQYKNSSAEISITISASADKAGQSIDIVQFRKRK